MKFKDKVSNLQGETRIVFDMIILAVVLISLPNIVYSISSFKGREYNFYKINGDQSVSLPLKGYYNVDNENESKSCSMCLQGTRPGIISFPYKIKMTPRITRSIQKRECLCSRTSSSHLKHGDKYTNYTINRGMLDLSNRNVDVDYSQGDYIVEHSFRENNNEGDKEKSDFYSLDVDN